MWLRYGVRNVGWYILIPAAWMSTGMDMEYLGRGDVLLGFTSSVKEIFGPQGDN